MLNFKNSYFQINHLDPNFFYEFVSGKVLDYVVKFEENNLMNCKNFD
jgi:hypothetical protein